MTGNYKNTGVRFSPEAERWLRAAGWYPNRRVEVDKFVGDLRHYGGYEITDKVIAFLREFGNLELFGDHGYATLSTLFIRIDWWEAEVKPIREHLGLSLCPIANTHLGLWLMGPDGEVYDTDTGTYFVLLGNSTDQAIENHIHERYIKRLLETGDLRKINLADQQKSKRPSNYPWPYLGSWGDKHKREDKNDQN